MKTAGREFIYERIAGNIEVKIKTEVLKIGDRLPSLRELCGEHGISMNSALQAYLVLEGKGLIESRPQSGYYVCYSHRRFPAAPATSKPIRTAGEATSALISKVYADIGTGDHILLSLGVPDTSLLPVAKLNKAIMQGLRDLEGSGTVYDRIQGNLRLRRQIAIGSFHWNGQLNEDDIITTAGCMNALSFCLGALLQKGDTLVVESPVYFGILQLARSLGLKVLELPTNPVTGIELDALKQTIARHKVKACLLVSNFNNPLGSCMPDEHKKEVVRLLTHHNIPLIEDDLYGDVYFGNQRPNSCKTYDESGIVLWCGSFSKTLAPGYRVGWVAPGRFKEQILQAKLFHAVSSATITQEAIGNFLETGRYENHLRKMRQTLRANSLQYMRAISEYFPHDTKVSHPGGGFIQWVELNKKADTTELYEQARRYKISIAPGRMFTLQDQYNNCLRLSYGLAWNEQLEQALKTLGRLAKAML